MQYNTIGMNFIFASFVFYYIIVLKIVRPEVFVLQTDSPSLLVCHSIAAFLVLQDLKLISQHIYIYIHMKN